MKWLATLIGCVLSLSALAQPLTDPFENSSLISAEQKSNLRELKEKTEQQRTTCLDQVKKNVILKNQERKTPFLIEYKTALETRSNYNWYSNKFIQQGMALLNPDQQLAINKLLMLKVHELSIPNFKRIPQEGDQLCWAACVQMVVNYKGIGATQEQVASLVSRTNINQNATYEELSNSLNTIQLSFTEVGERFFTQFNRIPYTKGDSTVGHQLVNQIGRNNIFLIGINRHMCFLHTVKYNFQYGPFPHLISVIYYDPLANKDVELSWNEADAKVADWFMCYAGDGRESFFNNDPKYDLSKFCN